MIHLPPPSVFINMVIMCLAMSSEEVINQKNNTPKKEKRIHKSTSYPKGLSSRWLVLVLLVEPASFWGENVWGVVFLLLISAMNKELLTLLPFIRFLVQAMCRNSSATCRWVTGAKPPSPLLMKLKLGFKIPSMDVCLIFLPFSSRFKISTLPSEHWLHIYMYIYRNPNFCYFPAFSDFQVVNLQAQLASLKEQAAQSLLNGSISSGGNLNEKFYGKLPSYEQDFQSWFQLENLNTAPQYDPNLAGNSETMPYSGNRFLDPGPMENYKNSIFPEENISFTSFEEASHHHHHPMAASLDMQGNNRKWAYQDDTDELRSVAFGFIRHSWPEFWSQKHVMYRWRR